MRRREFFGLIGGAAASWPLGSHAAQRQDMRKLGVLLSIAENDSETVARLTAFRQALNDLGWKDGENIHVEYRFGAGREDLIRQYAKELVAMAPDVIVASGTPVIAQLKALTQSISIVCALFLDPVGLGFVESLARPGGNITGFSFINAEMIVKWAALLKQAAPSLNRAALLYNPKINPWYANFLKEIAASGQPPIELISTKIETINDLHARLSELAGNSGAGLIIGPEAFMIDHMRELVALAASNRLPGISVYRQFAVEGGLMSYGPDTPDLFRRSAGYVDRILKGANPATLPVQQPSKFDFTINQRAAGALELALPPMLLAAATEVIE
jgi:putative tryptophan/tyrosine transport system substrate-binding protein